MQARSVPMLTLAALAMLSSGVCAAAASGRDERPSAPAPRSGRGRSLPNMMVREVSALGRQKLRVVVANVGFVASGPCLLNAAIYVDRARTERFEWMGQQKIGALQPGGQSTFDFDTSYPVYGHRVTAYVFQCALPEVDAKPGGGLGVNNRKTVDIAARAEEPKREPKPEPSVAEEKPRMSPDLAATDVYFEDGEVVGVVTNVGDRAYTAAGSNYKDSFDRQVTLKRVKLVGAHRYTETVRSYGVPHLGVGESQKFGFTRPKKDPEATEYQWVLALDGRDPEYSNNSFTKVEKVTPAVRLD